jgi:protein-export membrane protein SecD
MNILKILDSVFKGFIYSIVKPTPRDKIRWAIFGILVLILLAGSLDYPKYWDKSVDWVNAKTGLKLYHFPKYPFRLGLDLLGGTHLVYEADMKEIASGERDSALEGARDVIERRVNAFGVAEPLVQTNKSGDSWRVVVELAGIKDVREAIKMIGETPILEFKEEGPPQAARELTESEKQDMAEYNSAAKEAAEEALAKVLEPGADFNSVAATYMPDQAGEKENIGDVGFAGLDKDYENIVLALYRDGVGKGQILPEVIETPDGYNIVKAEETRDGPRKVKASHILICYEGAEGCAKETTKEEALRQITDLQKKVTPKNFAEMAKQYSTEPGAATTGGDLGWFAKGAMVEPFELVVFDQKVGTVSRIVETKFGYHLIYKVDDKKIPEYHIRRILLKTKKDSDYVNLEPWQASGLSGKQLKRAVLEFDQNSGMPQVGLEFNDEGKSLFAEITRRNVGKMVAIFLDGSPISIPRVQEPILEGKAVISGDFDLAEAKTLVQRLNAGALPVPVKLISQQSIGASLGGESLHKSLIAALIGFLLVALFMILYYRAPGVLATLALVVYAAIVLAIFKLIPVTLTLAGIAGFVLSVGMAVDANVLIFERLKEELRAGKTYELALPEAFSRAWPSIRDGNFTTLIACAILFWFSESLIKGFALTLSIGILISMFTALTITRSLMKFFGAYMKNWLILR